MIVSARKAENINKTMLCLTIHGLQYREHSFSIFLAAVVTAAGAAGALPLPSLL